MHTIALKSASPVVVQGRETKSEAPGDAITRQVDALFPEFSSLKQRIEDATQAGLDSMDVAEVRSIVAALQVLRGEAPAIASRVGQLREAFTAEEGRLSADIEAWSRYNSDKLDEMEDAAEFPVDIDHYVGEFQRWISEMEADDGAPEPKSRRLRLTTKLTALDTISGAPLLGGAIDLDSTGLMAEPPVARKVVVMLADADSQAALRAYAEEHGFDLAASYGGEPRAADDFEFHVTLFATEGPSALPEISGPMPPVLVTPSGFAALGPEKTTPVIELEVDDTLSALRAGWLASAAATPTYPDFRPHLTLSYTWAGEPALDTLPLPDFPIVLDRISVRSLNDPAEKSMPTTKRTALPVSDADAPSILPLVTDLVDTLAAAGDDPEVLDAIEEEATRLGETDIRSDPAADEVEPLLLDLLAEINRRRLRVAA